MNTAEVSNAPRPFYYVNSAIKKKLEPGSYDGKDTAKSGYSGPNEHAQSIRASGQTTLSSSSVLMGNLSRFQLAIDHIKNKRMEL